VILHHGKMAGAILIGETDLEVCDPKVVMTKYVA